MKFLRKLFGPSQGEIWSQLAQEIGAHYEKGGFFKPARVTLAYRHWKILLDTYSHSFSSGKHTQTIHYTRIRAPFVSKNGLRLKVYRKSIFSRLGKAFGIKSIALGYPCFDDTFIIQGKPENMVRSLLSNELIRELIHNQKDISFEIKDDEGWWTRKKYPQDVDLLYFQATGVIKDKERLKELFNLFSLTLDELCNQGAASEDDPEIKL